MHSIPQRETTRAADAFAEYAAIGPERSLVKLYEYLRQTPGKPQVNYSTLEDWSRAHRWQQRVCEYDQAQRAIRAAKHQADIEKMNERHALIGTTQQRKALEQIEALIAAQKFGSQATVMLLKLATELERTARGAPSNVERHEMSGPGGDPLSFGAEIEDDPEAANLARALIARVSYRAMA